MTVGLKRWPVWWFLGGLVACGGGSDGGGGSEPPPPARRPSSLVVVAGDGQTSPVGDPLPTNPSVQVRDQNGAAMAGVVVLFGVAGGGGSVPSSATTDAQGQASVAWTLGPTVGVQQLTARVDGVQAPVTISATATAGPPRSVRMVSGDRQEGLPGQALAQPLRVVVRDRFGNPVPSRPVVWTPTGGGTASPVGNTDTAGTASAIWALGPIGPQQITATAEGVQDSIAVFSAELLGIVSGTVTSTSRYNGPPLAAAAGAAEPKRALRPPPLDEEVPDELLVHFRSGPVGAPPVTAGPARINAAAPAISAAIRSALASYARSGVLQVAGVSPAIAVARVRIPAGQSRDAVAAMLLSDPNVASVEPNHIVHRMEGRAVAAAPVVPADPDYRLQSWHYGQIQLPIAWSRTTGSASVIVAVVDDGIRFDHPDLQGQLTNDGYDFVSPWAGLRCTGEAVDLTGDGDGYDPDPTIPAAWSTGSFGCLDRLSTAGGHGTHVAGTIVARGNNGVGGTGVAPGVRVRPIRVLNIKGSGTDYDIAQGILYAAGLPVDNGRGVTMSVPPARVINLSLGGPYGSAEQQAVSRAHAAGVLLVAAAGNEGSIFPSYPAAFPEVISVAATDPFGRDATYSNWGSTIDLAAPGGELLGGVDHGVYSTAWNFVSGTPTYAAWQGTSMAAPHVSAVAALVMSAEPGLTATQVRQRLESTARDVRTPGWDSYTGYGIVDAAGALGLYANPRRTAYAFNAVTGAMRGPVNIPGATFTLPVPTGVHLVYVAEQLVGDDGVATPMRRWGTVGITGQPTPVSVAAGGTTVAPVTLGFPIESEPNDTPDGASVLPLGGYLFGSIAPGQVDYFRLAVPASGTVVVETFGDNWAACGLAVSANTRLTVLSRDGASTLGANDDVDPTNLCSRITLPLEPGTYLIRVEASPMVHGSTSSKGYAIRARAGP